MLDRLFHRRAREHECPACGTTLDLLHHHADEGEPWEGPYFECSSCGNRYRNEADRLVLLGPPRVS
jgi:predicted RNA-binding Zn-ribbon protein involved in translation (DUF1610 family)